MDYNARMELRTKRYNILMEQYLMKIFSEEMNTLQFKFYHHFISPLENWAHWKREEYRDMGEDPRKYKLFRHIQAILWAIPFLSLKKGYQIVEGLEKILPKATPK